VKSGTTNSSFLRLVGKKKVNIFPKPDDKAEMKKALEEFKEDFETGLVSDALLVYRKDGKSYYRCLTDSYEA